jgi:hypothetical protein
MGHEETANRHFSRFLASKKYGGRARGGLLLHAGRALEWLTADVLAAPWWRVL